jgi:hypothetical protein
MLVTYRIVLEVTVERDPFQPSSPPDHWDWDALLDSNTAAGETARCTEWQRKIQGRYTLINNNRGTPDGQ